MSDPVYRHIITGQLITTSPMAIHSGDSYAPSGKDAPPFRIGDFRNKERCDQLILRDHSGKPYIPGSSIKGVLRNFVQRFASSKLALVETIFGKDSVANDSSSRGGCVIFEDAFLDDGRAWQLGDDEDHKTLKNDSDISRSYERWVEAIRSSHCLGNKDLAKLHRVFHDYPKDDSFAEGSWRQTRKNEFLSDGRQLPFWSSHDLTYVEQHVSINRRTGVANEHMLYDSEAVPAGLPFFVQVIIAHPCCYYGKSEYSVEQISRHLLQWLAAFNLDPVHHPPQLGACTNIGWGLMDWNVHRARLFRQTPGKINVVEKLRSEDEEKELSLVELQRKVFSIRSVPTQPTIQFDLELAMVAQFLVNDSSKVKDADSGSTMAAPRTKSADDFDHYPRMKAPDLSSKNDWPEEQLPSHGYALLPASAAKGALRSRLERIVRTICESCEWEVSPHRQLTSINEKTASFLRHLFGLEDFASGFWVSEFVGLQSQTVRKQELVAIDRWTGGTADGAKFDVGFFECPVLRGSIRFTLPAVTDDEGNDDQQKLIGLISLLISDLVHGEVRFGFGQSKGYGECVASITDARFAGFSDVTTFNSMDWLNPDNVDESLCALRRKLQTEDDASSLISGINQFINSALDQLRNGTETCPVESS